MSKYNSTDVKVEIKDDVDGSGTYREVQTDILDIPAITEEALMEECHGFGPTELWVKHQATGLKQIPGFTLRMFYDDAAATAGGTDALFNRVGSAADLKITWDTGTTPKVTKFLALIKSYSLIPTRGEKTKCEVALEYAGAETP